MNEDNNHLSEDELRKSIRAEIEQRDLERVKSQRRKESQRLVNQQTEMKRKLYREEMDLYYRDKPGYAQIIGDDGEPEWVLEDEMRDNERLFDTVHEDPIEGKRTQKYFIIGVIFALILMAGGIYYLLSGGVGNIIVTSNVQGAEIILDAAPTTYYTNYTLAKISAGEHILTVEKQGYHIVGEDIIKVDLKRGTTEEVVFILEPEPSVESGDEE
ncbi:MAG: PEGA domain-containing protein [bacterium]